MGGGEKCLFLRCFSRVGDFFQNITGLISRVFVSAASANARFLREKRGFFENRFSRRFLSIDSFLPLVDRGGWIAAGFFLGIKFQKLHFFLFNRAPRWLEASSSGILPRSRESCRVGSAHHFSILANFLSLAAAKKTDVRLDSWWAKPTLPDLLLFSDSSKSREIRPTKNTRFPDDFASNARSYLLFLTLPKSNLSGFRGFSESAFCRPPLFSKKTRFFSRTFSRPFLSGADLLVYSFSCSAW
jgi:hypothetical protein